MVSTPSGVRTDHRSFVIPTGLLLDRLVHLLQSQLLRCGDYVAGPGVDAMPFLDAQIRIFGGIRERAGLSVRRIPKKTESLFVLSLPREARIDTCARRQPVLDEQLKAPDAQKSELRQPSLVYWQVSLWTLAPYRGLCSYGTADRGRS